MAAATRAAAPPSARAWLTAWAPVVLWVAVIGWLSGDGFSDEHTASWLAGASWLGSLGLPPALIGMANWILRKTAHVVEYAVLAALAYRGAARTDRARGALAHVLLAVTLAVACAALDELHQATTATRSGSLKDFALNGAGALAGAAAAAGWARRRRRA